MRIRRSIPRPAYSSDNVVDLGGYTGLTVGEGLRDLILSTAILDDRRIGNRLSRLDVDDITLEEEDN